MCFLFFGEVISVRFFGMFFGFVAIVLFSTPVFSQSFTHQNVIDLPLHECLIIAEVADQYELEGDARLLLFIIRKIENGRSGYAEFGVLHPRAIGRGFRVQAEWAAGTIKRRFAGDLAAFAKRWAPVGAKNDPTGLNNHWYGNATLYMSKLKSQRRLGL